MVRILGAISCILLCCSVAQAESMVTSWYSARGVDIAAHRSYPFGTILRLTNPNNGLSATVRIYDCGPFIKGRQLDVSRAKAVQLGFLDLGVIRLDAEILRWGSDHPACAKRATK
jgi:rare lipoprotein A